MRDEPIALYRKFDKVNFNKEECIVLSIHTYNTKTDEFLDQAYYTLKSVENNTLHRKVSEESLITVKLV